MVLALKIKLSRAFNAPIRLYGKTYFDQKRQKMKNLSVFILFFSFEIAAKETKTKAALLCDLKDKKIRIDISQTIEQSGHEYYKAEFLRKNAYFGNCLLKIEKTYDTKKGLSAFNQIIFSIPQCTFLSEKHSKDFVFVKKGIINYNLNEVAFVDMFTNIQPLECKIKK